MKKVSLKILQKVEMRMGMQITPATAVLAGSIKKKRGKGGDTSGLSLTRDIEYIYNCIHILRNRGRHYTEEGQSCVDGRRSFHKREGSNAFVGDVNIPSAENSPDLENLLNNNGNNFSNVRHRVKETVLISASEDDDNWMPPVKKGVDNDNKNNNKKKSGNAAREGKTSDGEDTIDETDL
ncbi:hypothetical protein LSM04_005586 [Trypanosoma melophagium]|uniref:uncharacterized protein n=1 Tax=Trypanosoma melophagium TaxID=715481 RepID=UPI00351A2835|nr:hypothetical protein LSM04_005586 [Trypanosoma melophagium]